MLRVKKGPCAPERFSSMLSSPATGITRMERTTGVWPVAVDGVVLIQFSKSIHASLGASLTRLTSCVGLTKRSAIRTNTRVMAMYITAMASMACGGRTPVENTP